MLEASWFVVTAGSNIEPATHLPAALRRLRRLVMVDRLSAIYETAPVDAPGTPDFWNAAILVRSALSPERLKLEVLRPIEAELGRERTSDPNAPRTIDLDIVLWSEGVLDDPESGLRLPDPNLTTHAHLAVPVSELVGDWIDPDSGRPLAELAGRLTTRMMRLPDAAWG